MTDEQEQTENEEEEVESKEEKQDVGLIDNAVNIANKLEQENNKFKELLDRQENLMAKQKLAGKTMAGTTNSKKAEQTNKEYALEAISGKLNGN
jgi:hypothetical protein